MYQLSNKESQSTNSDMISEYSSYILLETESRYDLLIRYIDEI